MSAIISFATTSILGVILAIVVGIIALLVLFGLAKFAWALMSDFAGLIVAFIIVGIILAVTVFII